MITLISALILGGIALSTDFYVQKAKQELINKNDNEAKGQLNRLYRVTVNRINAIEDNIQEMDRKNRDEHEQLNASIKSLTYAVTKNNKEIKKTLKEIKENNNLYNYSGLVYKNDTTTRRW